MNYITLSEAAKSLPGRPHASALWRWCRKGVRTRGGRRIYLAHIRLGQNIYVKPEELELFGRKVAMADGEHFAVHEPSSVANATEPSPRGKEVTGAYGSQTIA